MAVTLFSSLTEEDKSDAVQQLINESAPRDAFFFMTILSVLMATFGLIINNASVVIGSMLIAPLLSPVLSLALGVVIADFRLIYRSFFTLTKAVLFAVPLSAVASIFFLQELGMYLNPEILARAEPSIIFAAIGIVAGLAASFAIVKPGMNEALPGVAVSVALIPPLGVMGIGIARFDWVLVNNALMVFLINVVGIMFASMVIFSLMNLYVERRVADKAIKESDKKLEKEEKKAEKIAEQASEEQKTGMEKIKDTVKRVGEAVKDKKDEVK